MIYILNKIINKCKLINKYLSNNICCFTGPRCQKLPWGFNENDNRCLKMKEITKKEIEKSISLGYKVFISGMAIGFDMICAEIVLNLKEIYPEYNDILSKITVKINVEPYKNKAPNNDIEDSTYAEREGMTSKGGLNNE